MLNPYDNVGKVCKSLEKYFDTRTGRIKVKSRPVLIIGFEDTYDNPIKIDYEVLPISSLANINPDPNFDFYLNEDTYNLIGLDRPSYIRSHKTSWTNVKNMRIDEMLGDLKQALPATFNSIIELNREWVNKRTNAHSIIISI
ncbi:hypothetical protein [Mesobacillus stamsii]|uniref:Uncharacterized protein n=1 Tax=Mesobacillus stamsii TaxID=225347 RepID=A0ABU0FS50_9BACI|nr:hypothetical protein [Mesobacillus stamsii]MDQ0412741.1 hypothetical protein [Mesobacillus stamsii]